MTDPRLEPLAAALHEAWPKHIEGSLSLPSSPNDRTWTVEDPTLPSEELAASILAALDATPTGELDAAWAAAEAALPEGWLELGLTRRNKSALAPYCASISDGSQGAMTIRSGHAIGFGHTPAAALRALAARLTSEESA